jgi:hypothetical protein
VQNYNFNFYLYGYETWCVTLREQHRLGVCENWVLMVTFVPKRGEVTGGCRDDHNETRHDLYPRLIIYH